VIAARLPDRSSLAGPISLVAGAAVGAVTLPNLVEVSTRPVTTAALALFALHGALTGATAMAAGRLVRDRLIRARAWNAPAAALVAVAAGSLWFLPLVGRSVDGHLFYADPARWLAAARAARDPDLLTLAAYFHCWPLACLAVWIGCCLSGQAAGWWRLAGDRFQCLGMWLLAAWSLPAFCLVWQIWWQFLREDLLFPTRL
jgi:hypothetical protein